jgi:hypothetical protein
MRDGGRSLPDRDWRSPARACVIEFLLLMNLYGDRARACGALTIRVSRSAPILAADRSARATDRSFLGFRLWRRSANTRNASSAFLGLHGRG